MKSNKSSWLLPVENYVIRTKLTEEEALQRLNYSTKNSGSKSNASLFGLGTLFGQKSDGPYEGTVTSNSFKISRVISYRNSFLPVIKGTIGSYQGKTEITISMTLNLLVKIFMIVWLSLAGIPSAIILIALVRMLLHFYFKGFTPFLLIPIGMFIFGYSLMILAFKFEVKKSKKDLDEIFEAEQSNML